MNRFFFLITIATYLCMPWYALAADVPAGFAPHSIWISKQSATAGDSVRIFTVVYNSATSSLSGTVHFYVDDTDVGTSNVTLNAGETKVQSLAWLAVAGTHTLQADFENPSLPLSNATTEPVSITIASSLPPPAYVQAMQSAAQTASVIVASTTPIVQQILSTTINTTEAMRQAGENYLSSAYASDTAAVTSSATKKAPTGSVLGTSTTALKAASVFTSSKLAAEQAGKKIFGSAALFYPIAALVFFLLMYLLTRGIKSPKN